MARRPRDPKASSGNRWYCGGVVQTKDGFDRTKKHPGNEYYSPEITWAEYDIAINQPTEANPVCPVCGLHTRLCVLL